MILAFLLQHPEPEPRLIYGDQVILGGIVCLLVAFAWWLAARLLKKEKPQKFSYWVWVFAGSGIAMVVLGFVLEMQNPGIRL